MPSRRSDEASNCIGCSVDACVVHRLCRGVDAYVCSVETCCLEHAGAGRALSSQPRVSLTQCVDVCEQWGVPDMHGPADSLQMKLGASPPVSATVATRLRATSAWSKRADAAQPSTLMSLRVHDAVSRFCARLVVPNVCGLAVALQMKIHWSRKASGQSRQFARTRPARATIDDA